METTGLHLQSFNFNHLLFQFRSPTSQLKPLLADSSTPQSAKAPLSPSKFMPIDPLKHEQRERKRSKSRDKSKHSSNTVSSKSSSSSTTTTTTTAAAAATSSSTKGVKHEGSGGGIKKEKRSNNHQDNVDDCSVATNSSRTSGDSHRERKVRSESKMLESGLNM